MPLYSDARFEINMDAFARMPGRRPVGFGLRELPPEIVQPLVDEVRREFGLDPNPDIQKEVVRLNEVIATLRRGPTLLATVTWVGHDRVRLVVGSKHVEAARPTIDVTVGATVMVTSDTLQIVGAAADCDRPGEVATVKAILPCGGGEIERGGASRIVTVPVGTKPGERVVVDETWTVAVRRIGPEPNRHAYGDASRVTWDDIGGGVEAKTAMREAVEGPFKQREAFERFRKRPTKGVLLYGPAGCGKTLLGKAAATALAELHGSAAQGAFFYVKGPEVLDPYVGKSEANIRKLFEDARRHRRTHGFPAIIFLDEAEALLGRRGGPTLGVERSIVPQFLAEMDGLDECGALVIIATNRPGDIDPAIVRDGRCDRKIRVTRPSAADALEIVARALSGKPLESDAGELAQRLVDGVFAQLALVKVYRQREDALSEKRLLLHHTISGAMLIGVVERAISRAMARDSHAISASDIDAAVIQTYNESLDIDHREDLAEVFGDTLAGAARIEKGKPLSLGGAT